MKNAIVVVSVVVAAITRTISLVCLVAIDFRNFSKLSSG